MEITGNRAILRAADMFHEAGERFTEIGLLFKEAETMSNLYEKIEIASQKFSELADFEEKAYSITLEASSATH